MARVQHGELTMETAETEGTTVRLELLRERRQMPRETPDTGFAAMTVVPDAAMAIPALRILLVDDDPDNTLIMKLFLPSPPLDVETAGNGREAVDACRLRRPDVIFMDLEMPVMGGFEALKRIRALQAERGDAPSRIVAFSAHDDEASRLRSVNAGFDLHLSKPSSQSEIFALLSGSEFHSRSAGDVAEALPVASVFVDDDIFDAIPAFLESRRDLVAALRQALAAGERESLRQLAHKLKGSFSMYGFRWAAKISRELEDNHQNPDSKFLTLQVDALEQHLAQVKIRSRTHPVRGVLSR
jgi:CheY-like chemotaxis protein